MSVNDILRKEHEALLDSSDEEDLRNTVGNVPLKWYDDYDHIGYDLDAQKIPNLHKSKNDLLDEFIDKMENSNYGRTVYDNQTGEAIVLTDHDIEIIKNLSQGRLFNKEADQYEVDFSQAFMSEEIKTSLSARPEHKRSFIPSKWEKLQVGKYVHAIKMGWIKPKKQAEKQFEQKFYDLWNNENDEMKLKRYMHNLPAPKIPLPQHEASYNPPAEYLLNENEIEKLKQNEEADLFIPKKYPSLRLVPAYDQYIKEQFNRCLDMYLCPRQRKMKVQVNPEDLIPKLPKPKDLQPFPNQLSIVYKGHSETIRAISIHQSGQWLVSGSDDKTIKFWEVSTSRCLKTVTFKDQIVSVAWAPGENLHVVLVVSHNAVTILNPKLGDKIRFSSTDNKIKEYSSMYNQIETDIAKWQFFNSTDNDESYKSGKRIQIIHQKELKYATWHGKGDYFVSVIDDKTTTNSIVIHQLSKQKSIMPFAKMKGIVQQVKFHPFKPILFVATQKYVKIYDLVKQALIKKLLTNCNYITSLDVHPGGDNLIIGGIDNRVTWFDLDLSAKPYKILKYHKKAIRDVTYHKKYPLFASASEDGTAIVCHGMVYNDLNQNPLIVPLKILRANQLQKKMGVMSCEFHPTQPWLFTANSDNTIKLFTN